MCSISSDRECQSKEIGVGMEVRLLSVGARGFFSRCFATHLRGFASQFCRPQREKKPLAPRVRIVWIQFIYTIFRATFSRSQQYYTLQRTQRFLLFSYLIQIKLCTIRILLHLTFCTFSEYSRDSGCENTSAQRPVFQVKSLYPWYLKTLVIENLS